MINRQVFSIAIVLALAVPATAQRNRQDSDYRQRTRTSYSGITEIELHTVSGSCQVERSASSDVSVDVDYSFDPSSYEADIQQRGSLLIMKERFHGRSNSGNSNWRLMVPDNIRISFSTASGDFQMSELRPQIDVSTASGDIRLTDVEGEIDASTASGVSGRLKLSSASGDVDVENGVGEFKVSSNSGDVFARDLEFESDSFFSSASGNARLRLSSSPQFDLKVLSVSGDATLELNGVELRGSLEVTARKDRNIRAPFSFQREETIYRWNQEYVMKSIDLGEGP